MTPYLLTALGLLGPSAIALAGGPSSPEVQAPHAEARPARVLRPAILRVEAQPAEIAAGVDLQAFQALEQQRLVGSAAVEAYRHFVVAWPTSPLAVVAWDRLVGLGAADIAFTDPITWRDTIEPLRKRWERSQAALESATRGEVAVIDFGGSQSDAAVLVD